MATASEIDLPKWQKGRGGCQNGRLKFRIFFADTCSKETTMYNLIMILGFLGYGAGYEGCDCGKWYFGIYTPQAEYGWVVTSNDIYLDTVFFVDK